MDHREKLKEINNFLLGGREVVDIPKASTEEEKPKEVIVKKYIIEVTIYPDGQEFTKSWMISKGPKKKFVRRKKSTKPMNKTKITEREEY